MAETPRTHHRPELHLTAEDGLLFAPAGALLDGDTWHVFHQYRPEPDAGPRWAHQFSDQAPFVWDICDDVLAPKGGETQIRAGSVVSNKGGVDLYYTSVTEAGSAIHVARIEDLAATTESVSENALDLDAGVIRIGKVVSDTDSYTKFRSPCVVPDWGDENNREDGHEGWLMLAVSGPSDKPDLVILTSADGRDWQISGPLTFKGLTGLSDDAVLVSPRMIRLRDEVDHEIYDVVIVTIERDGVDISGYVVGQLNGTEFDVVTPFTRIDHGHDFSRPRNTNYTEGTQQVEDRYAEAHIFGLMNGIGRLDDPTRHKSWKEEGWANTISVPRVVTLQEGTLFQTPPSGLLEAIYESDAAAGWTALCDIPAGSSVSIELRDQKRNTAAIIHHRHNVLVIDRSMNPYYEGDPVAMAPLSAEDTDSLFIIVDGSTVEVFADGGDVAMASRVYFENGPIYNFEVSTAGDATILNAQAHYPDDFSTVGLPDLDELTQFDADEHPHEGPVR
ncbi:MAG: glycoside hydrolase family 32 protein [Corynebacterium sp.]|nr:glycoside hydrolase family 32 protein [Corynebacterium sp.]